MALSDQDKTLSASQQAAIQKATNDWNTAKAKGDQAGMDAAHAAAEKIRNQSGYSGGNDGISTSTIGSSGSSGSGNKNTGSGASSSTSSLVSGSASSNKNQTATTVAGNVSGGTTANSNNYYINSYDGVKQASSMKAGDSFTASDGSVWTMGSDGKLSVRRSDGRTQTGVVGSLGKYTINTPTGIEKYNNLKEGETFTDTNGAVWTRKADGTIVVSRNGKDYIAALGSDGSGSLNTNATDVNNNPLAVFKDENGNITGVYNADGSTASVRGTITVMEEGGGNTQYIVSEDAVSGKLRYVRAVSGKVAIVSREGDGTLPEVTLTGENGSKLSGANLVFGEDGHAYDSRTGQTIGELASAYGIDIANYAIKLTTSEGEDKYFSSEGEEITDALGVAAVQQWTGDDIYDALINGMMAQGWNQVPQFSDYEQLTWEQALAQAQEQLSSSYEKSLNDTLDELNQKALETGFYGQLPTEALKQQAASASELDKQSAIYDLARNLLNDSHDYAQQQYDNDMNTSESRLSTIQTIFNYVYQISQDKITSAQTQQELDNQMQSIILDAIQLYATLTGQGMNNAQILSYITTLMSQAK